MALATALLVIGGGVVVALLDDDAQPTAGEPGDASGGAPDDAPGDVPTTDGSAPGTSDLPTAPLPSMDPDDDGDLEPAVADAHRELFGTIDAAERTMIALSGDLPATATDLGDDELAAFEAEADQRVAELERLRDELEAMDTGGSADIEAIREAYLAHLSDWIDWGRAVAADPTLVDRRDAAQPYFDAINFSADTFSSSVARNLDRTAAPDDVVDLADAIIERGFSSSDDGTEI